MWFQCISSYRVHFGQRGKEKERKWAVTYWPTGISNTAILVTGSFQHLPGLCSYVCQPCNLKGSPSAISVCISWKQQPLRHQKLCLDCRGSKNIHDWGVGRQKQSTKETMIDTKIPWSTSHGCLLAPFILGFLSKSKSRPCAFIDTGLLGTRVALVGHSLFALVLNVLMSSHVPQVGSQH